MTLVVNLFGGPGSGKSTTAAAVFSDLKRAGVEVELVTEYAKDLTWEERHGGDGPALGVGVVGAVEGCCGVLVHGTYSPTMVPQCQGARLNLLTAREVADMLGVTRATVNRWARMGTLPCVRLPGGATRFDPDDIAAWIAERHT